jgi:hypothetical protein
VDLEMGNGILHTRDSDNSLLDFALKHAARPRRRRWCPDGRFGRWHFWI